MGVYSQVANVGFLGAEAVLLGSLLLLLHKSESFEKLVSFRLGGHLSLAYMTFGLPLMLSLMRIRGSRGIFRFLILGVLLIFVLLVVIGVLALIAFLIYRFLRRRQ